MSLVWKTTSPSPVTDPILATDKYLGVLVYIFMISYYKIRNPELFVPASSSEHARVVVLVDCRRHT